MVKNEGNTMTGTFDRILILSPHIDDGEFGCGASIAKFIAKGADVYYAAFSLAEESVPPPFPKDILKTEVKEATKELGISKENIILYNYQVRHLAQYRQEILEHLVKLNNELKPDLVFLPCLTDLHQDHSTIAMEGLRAFKKTSILGYEIPWNNLNFSTQCFVVLNEHQLQKKIKALLCYKSQMGRDYASEEFIRSLAKTRGIQIGEDWAEAFEVLRWKI